MSQRIESLESQIFSWNGALDPSLVKDEHVAASHSLADAAKMGDWSTVFNLLDDETQTVDINWWRPGGTAWFTVLHQAAWHAAPPAVVAGLIARGALTTLTDSRGRTALDIRIERDAVAGTGHASSEALRKLLEPSTSPLAAARIRALDHHLAAVIDSRIGGRLYDGRNPQQVLRYPPVAILQEVPDHRLRFPVPGMYGGFDIALRRGYLETSSWSRVVGGSGQAHVITHAGAVLVDEGFV